MLLGVVLLYVGAVLVVNGIWLIGQARAAAAERSVPAARQASAREAAVVGASAGEAAGGQVSAGEAGARQASAGEAGVASGAVAAVSRAERSPLFIQNREIAVLNIFTGFVGVVAAVTLLVQGNRVGDLASVRASGYILLFAFTYLWVAFNQFLNAGGRAFGWYCLFVAITAIPAGIYVLQAADGNAALTWLGIDWFAWAVLWALFWALLALGRPIALFTGWVTVLVGVGTAWAFAIAILEGKVAF
jgi:putative amide transporter protein